MKNITKKLATLFLTAVLTTSFLAVSLNSTAYAEVKQKEGSGESCQDGWIDFSKQGGPDWCVSGEDLEKCPDKSKFEYTIKGQDYCNDPAAAATEKESKIAQESFQKFSALVIGFESMISKLLWPILVLTGDLMNNNILFSPGMEQKLYDIWVPVRNIVNIFFVIALIGLALYSVLGINSENGQYSIKAMLPKLIAGIIAVNFSFIAIKVVLDTVNVFTTSIFAIPTHVEGLQNTVLDNSDGGKMASLRKAFCEQIYLDGKRWGGTDTEFEQGIKNTALFIIRDRFGLGSVSDAATIESLSGILPEDKKKAFNAELEKMQTELTWCKADGKKLKLTTAGEQFFQKYNSQNAALAMAINMGEIMFYNRPSTSLIGSGTYESLAIKVLFIFLMYIIYGASFIALFVILLARLIVVWLGLAMSPVIALSIAVPVVKDKLGLGELTSKFMKHAIAPIMVAFPMMVGWVMLNALHSTSSSLDATYGGAKDMVVPGIPIPGLETLQGLLISLATAAVVWIGVFAAAQGTLAEKVTGFIKDQLERFGKFVATAPIKYTPWVPVQMQEGGQKEMYSPGALLYAGKAKLDKMESDSERAFVDKHPEWLGPGGATGPTALNYNTTKEDLIKNLAENGKKFGEDEYKKAMKEKLKNNEKLIKDLKAMQSSEIADERKFAEAMLAGINGDEEALKKVNWKDLQQWAEGQVKESEKGGAEAKAEEAAAVDSAKKYATGTLGYNEDDVKEGGKAAGVVAQIKAADRIKVTGVEDNPEEMKKIAEKMVGIKDNKGNPLGDEAIKAIIENRVDQAGVKGEAKDKKMNGMKKALKAVRDEQARASEASATPQGGAQTPPPTATQQGGTATPPQTETPPAEGSQH